MRISLLIAIFLLFKTNSSKGQIKPDKLVRWDSIFNRVIELETEGKFEQAIFLLDSAKSIDSSKEEIYKLKAENLWMAGQFKLAAENYQIALLLDKDSSYLFGAYLFLGVLYEKANSLDQAKSQYSKAVYNFETKKNKTGRLFESSNKEDYAISLFLSGNTRKWDSLISHDSYKILLDKYIDKSREEVLKVYFEPYEYHKPDNSNEQGKLVDGLRTGFWIENGYNSYTTQGNYKIIPFAKYDTVKQLGRTIYKVKYKGSTPLIFFHEKIGNEISVKDSIWNSYDQAGNIREIKYWTEGLNQWTKYYDEKGNLVRHDYHDFEKDTSFQYTYINGQLFKKAFYPPENKNRQTQIYYPNEPLILSDAELSFVINFLEKPTVSEEVTLAAKKDLTINSISSQRNFVTLKTTNNRPITFPLQIKANTRFPLRIIVSPTPGNYQMTDTLTLVTTENQIPYKIYANINAHHINLRTVETLTSLQLSKTKDKFLILPTMGTVTDATIISKSGKEFFYEIEETTKIDLSTFSVGVYQLQISSCNTGGRLKLVIKE